jgi:hypothetical protein
MEKMADNCHPYRAAAKKPAHFHRVTAGAPAVPRQQVIGARTPKARKKQQNEGIHNDSFKV